MADFIDSHSMAPAAPGMKADAGNDRVETYPAESFVPFGNVMVLSSTGAVKVGTGTPRGIAVHTHSIPDSGYRQFDAVNCMVQGTVWARAAAGAVTVDGGPVYFTASGEVTNVADGNTLLTHAAFRSTVKSGTFNSSVVLVQLQSPLAA